MSQYLRKTGEMEHLRSFQPGSAVCHKWRDAAGTEQTWEGVVVGWEPNHGTLRVRYPAEYLPDDDDNDDDNESRGIYGRIPLEPRYGKTIQVEGVRPNKNRGTKRASPPQAEEQPEKPTAGKKARTTEEPCTEARTRDEQPTQPIRLSQRRGSGEKEACAEAVEERTAAEVEVLSWVAFVAVIGAIVSSSVACFWPREAMCRWKWIPLLRDILYTPVENGSAAGKAGKVVCRFEGCSSSLAAQIGSLKRHFVNVHTKDAETHTHWPYTDTPDTLKE